MGWLPPKMTCIVMEGNRREENSPEMETFFTSDLSGNKLMTAVQLSTVWNYLCSVDATYIMEENASRNTIVNHLVQCVWAHTPQWLIARFAPEGWKCANETSSHCQFEREAKREGIFSLIGPGPSDLLGFPFFLCLISDRVRGEQCPCRLIFHLLILLLLFCLHAFSPLWPHWSNILEMREEGKHLIYGQN